MAVITDPNGRVLFHIRNKMIAIRKTYVGEDDNGNEIFRIKKSIGCEWAGWLGPVTMHRLRYLGPPDEVLDQGSVVTEPAAPSTGKADQPRDLGNSPW